MLNVNDVNQIYLGCQGENLARTIVIDVKPWLVAYPSGVVTIYHKRNGASEATPTGAVFDSEEGTVTWQPSSADTYVAGEGEAEIRLAEGSVVKKSRKIKTGVAQAVTGSGTPLGSGWQYYVNAIEAYKSAAALSKAGAEAAADYAENCAAAAMAASQGKQVKFEIADDDGPEGMSGHLLFWHKNQGEPWTNYIDLGPVDAYGLAVLKGYTGTKEQWATEIGNASTNAQTASTKAGEASASALEAEGFAVGEQNGEAVSSDSPYYHNNAEYYAGQAAGSATSAENSATDAAQYTAAAVHTWLENNVDPETGYVLDRTLTEELEAAPADLVGSYLEKYESLTNDGVYTIKASDLEQGYWAYSTKNNSRTDRLRNKVLIPVRAGMRIVYTNPTMKVYVGVLATPSSNSYLQTSGWKAAGGENLTIAINNDGYMTFMLEGSGTLTPSSYDSTVDIHSKLKIDEISSINIGGVNSFIHHGGINTSGDFYSSLSRVLIDFRTYGTVMKLTVKPGYQLMVYDDSEKTPFVYTKSIYNNTANDIVRFLYAYSGRKWAFVINKTTTTSLITFEEALTNVSIEKAANETTEVVPGLKKEVVEFAAGSRFYNLDYVSTASRGASAPIKIPKSGIRITNNPELFKTGANSGARYMEKLLKFRVVCVKMTDSGFSMITEEENADLYTESNTTNVTDEPVYIPYIEDAYIIINADYSDGTAAKLVNSIWVYSGEAEISGKTLGLTPVQAYIRGREEEPPYYYVQILRGAETAIINTSNYYGGALWLKYAKSITVNPKYTILAIIYKLNLDGTYEKVEDYYAYNPDPMVSGRACGVQHIDLTKYDFDGVVHFAIQCSVQYRARGSQANSYKVPIGMGVMSQYMDVFDAVRVEYRNGYQVTDEPGLPSILFDNVQDFMNYTYPLRYAGVYVNPHDADNTARSFGRIENVTPALYDGYDGNTVLLNVNGKSYYTAMGNPNSRCYFYKWSGEDAPEDAEPGYGITCTDFTSILLGLKENYWTTQYAFGENKKFTRVKDYWDARTEMDLLKPGDVLTQCYRNSSSGIDSHCMIVYEKKYVNGQLEAITVVEAGYPYTRFLTMYNDKYNSILGNFYTFKRLYGSETSYPGGSSGFRWINRIKPQYMNRIREIFDLSKSYTPGTIMCDRGTDSIYCVNRGVLDAWKLILTITDDEATAVCIYKDGTLLDPDGVLIGNETMNGLRIVDIKDQITSGGLYTLKVKHGDDIIDTVQERFYVQEPFDFDTDSNAPTGYKRIRIQHKDDLRYMVIRYGVLRNNDPNNKLYVNTFRMTYTNEDFKPDAQAGWHYMDVPNSIDVPEEYHTEYATEATYIHVIFIYGTDYGTFQLRSVNELPTAFSGYGADG